MSNKKSKYCHSESECLSGSEDEDETGLDAFDYEDGFLVHSDEDTQEIPRARLQRASESAKRKRSRGRPKNSLNKKKATSIQEMLLAPTSAPTPTVEHTISHNTPSTSVKKTGPVMKPISSKIINQKKSCDHPIGHPQYPLTAWSLTLTHREHDIAPNVPTIISAWCDEACERCKSSL